MRFMRFHFIIIPAVALLLTSCANEGVIVQKDTVPLPFYESLGVDGSYKLAVRDSSGVSWRNPDPSRLTT